MRIYGPAHGPENPRAEEVPEAEGHAPLATSEDISSGHAQLSIALRSATADLPGPIDALTLVIPAAQCRLATRSFPATLAEPEAHALATQMAVQIAAEVGHSGPIAFDWQRISTHEIALCVAPRALISGYIEAIHTAGLHCIAITPEAEPTAVPGSAPFNLLPWRNATWLERGRTRILWLAATTLLTILPAAWITTNQATHEQALIAQHAQLKEAIKTRQVQQPDLAKLRQQLAAQQAAQQADREAHAAALSQQRGTAARMDQLARKCPKGIRYHSLSYDSQGMRLEGSAQTPAALTRLLKTLHCPHLVEGHREGAPNGHGPLRFALQLPATCMAMPRTAAP